MKLSEFIDDLVKLENDGFGNSEIKIESINGNHFKIDKLKPSKELILIVSAFPEWLSDEEKK